MPMKSRWRGHWKAAATAESANARKRGDIPKGCLPAFFFGRLGQPARKSPLRAGLVRGVVPVIIVGYFLIILIPDAETFAADGPFADRFKLDPFPLGGRINVHFFHKSRPASEIGGVHGRGVCGRGADRRARPARGSRGPSGPAPAPEGAHHRQKNGNKEPGIC